MDDDTELRVKLVQRLVRRKVVGGHKKQVDTVKNWFRTDRQGEVEDLIRELIRDPEAPLEGYGRSRDNVRLTIPTAIRNRDSVGSVSAWSNGGVAGRFSLQLANLKPPRPAPQARSAQRGRHALR